jgi:Fe-S cluster assembly protein SufD
MDSAIKEISKKDNFLKHLQSSNLKVASESLASDGLKALEGLEFPKTSSEDWKYTRTGRISKLQFAAENTVTAVAVKSIPELISNRLVFVNGVFDDSQSTLTAGQTGVSISTLRDATQNYPNAVGAHLGQIVSSNQDIFTAINSAYNQDGLFLEVEKNTRLNQAIEVVLISTGNQIISNIRNLIVLNEGAEAHVIIRIESENGENNLINGVSECFVGQNASLQIDKLQLQGEECFQVFTEEVSQEKDSKFSIRTFTHSSDWVRNNLHISLNGSNSESNLSGAYMLEGKQHVDNHTVVDHKVPHCISKELYKGLIDDKSTGVFNGKVFVRPDAQKTEAYQSNANILLSDDASMNSKPELEIYADDVKCSHGSTTGQFDEDAVFYLKARGLDTRSAYMLLTTAFIGEVVQQVENTALKNYITRHMNLGEIYLDLE